MSSKKSPQQVKELLKQKKAEIQQLEALLNNVEESIQDDLVPDGKQLQEDALEAETATEN